MANRFILPVDTNWKQITAWIITALIGVYGIYQAIQLAWVGDDAFISFRYAQNLIHGQGLVFNAGETVEGYTNFLWTIIIAGGLALGFGPVIFSYVVSMTAFVITISIFIYLSTRLQNKSSKLIIPITMLALLVHHDFLVYATSGLETSLVTMLVSLGFATLLTAKTPKSFLWAGVVLVAAVLTRPDSLIFYVMALPFILFTFTTRVKSLLWFVIPVLLIYLPYWIWRYSCYGYPFPNTYYAKSAYLAYYSQGLIYLWLFAKTYYVILLYPAAIIFNIFGFFKQYTKLIESLPKKILLLSLLFVPPYIFYVVRTGGDFMFARFFIPVLPLILFTIESVGKSLLTKTYLRIALAILIIGGVYFRFNQFDQPAKVIHGIVDERTFYPDRAVELAKINGANLKKYLSDKDVVVGFYGSKAMTVYYSELPMAIECHTGLTDEYIAHLPLDKRSRPGHEKMAPHDYLYRRKVNFILKHTTELPKDRTRIISFNGSIAHIMVYDRVLMNRLKGIPEVKFIDYEVVLDRFITEIESFSNTQVLDMLRLSKDYYFDHNDDPARLQAILNHLNQ